ncbi:MAG: hypothetical protein JKY45_11535 [Emcibacter sp.]|nr:hypothetical protein [Emcibacter sp.]
MTDRKTPNTDHVVSTPITTKDPSPSTNTPKTVPRLAWAKRFRRFWPLLLSFSLSLIWVGVCIWWFSGSGKTLTRMPLYEVGGLTAGASLPLILVWLIALVYLRTDPLRDHQLDLSQSLNGLVTPLDMVQTRINTIVSGLHKEIKNVEIAGDVATTRIDNLEKRFQEQISNLFEVTSDAEAKGLNLQERLSTERTAFATLATDVTGQITELEILFKQIKFDSETITNTTRKNSEDVSAQISLQNEALNKRSQLVAEQMETISHALGNISREISENCDISENKLDNISQNLSNKQAELGLTLTNLSDHTDQICDKMDKQSQTITELSQTTADQSERMTATLLEQSTNLSTVATEAHEKALQSSEFFQTQADAMSQKLEEATGKSKILIDEAGVFFTNKATEIVQSSQTLADNLIGHMGRATEDLQIKSETLEHTISIRASSIKGALEEQTKTIHEKLVAHTDKTKEIFINQEKDFTGNLDRQFDGLMTKLEEQSSQIHLFSDDVGTKLDDSISSIETQAKRIDDAVKLTADNLHENTEKMNDYCDNFELLAEKYRSQISQSEVQLKTQHDALVSSLSHVSEHLETALHKLKDETGSLGEHTQQVISSIVSQTEQLSEHIDSIRDRTENTIRNIQEMGETVSTHFTATDSRAASLSENWLKTASLVENQCTETLSKLDALAEKLIEVEKENTHAADASEENMSKVTEQMQQASESIYLASASAIEAADETNRVIDQHAEKFQQLINALQMSNKSILIDAQAIEKKNRDKRGSHFSDLASKIIEQLQSLSIDINRYFEDDVPDKVWQNYVDGDKNAFLRRLKKMTNKKYTEAIRQKYKSDPEFRKHALEYIQIFEELMAQSMLSDTYSTFSVALISSETGKVYLALAQAIDRFNN